jgi:hypothetical protein
LGGHIFFPTLHLNFLFFNAWNPIGGERGIFYFYWEKILAFDSIGNDPNRWLKGAIMDCENWLLKASRVGHFEAASRWL